ncbi:MAG: hypothetical protein HRU43_07525 [Simkaniaceae bacterium]|nr:hypothetical protein [Simkaniaceae bacterium]
MRIETDSDTSSIPSFSLLQKVDSLSSIIFSLTLSYEKELCQCLIEAIDSSTQNEQIKTQISRLKDHLLNQPELDSSKLKEIITLIQSQCD